MNSSPVNENSFIIKKIQEQVFNQGHNYVPQQSQFRISSIAYCERKLQLQKFIPNLEKAFSLDTLGIFAVGEAIHRLIQSELSKDILLGREKKISFKFKEIELLGHVDLILLTDLGIKVCDIKSSNVRSFGYLDQYGPNEHHVIQANTYASIMKVQKFSILYVNKNNFNMKEFDFNVSDDLFVKVLIKAVKITKSIKDEILLGRLKEFPKFWECQYVNREKNELVKCNFFDLIILTT